MPSSDHRHRTRNVTLQDIRVRRLVVKRTQKKEPKAARTHLKLTSEPPYQQHRSGVQINSADFYIPDADFVVLRNTEGRHRLVVAARNGCTVLSQERTYDQCRRTLNGKHFVIGVNIGPRLVRPCESDRWLVEFCVSGPCGPDRVHGCSSVRTARNYPRGLQRLRFEREQCMHSLIYYLDPSRLVF